jgi:hypothetical protein
MENKLVKMEKISNAFSAGWWDGFLDETANMSQPAVFKDSLSAAETRAMRADILGILADFAQRRSTKYGMRLWLEGKQVLDMSDFFATAPEPGEDVDHWVQRAFGSQRFGIILNRGEKFSNRLSRFMAQRLQPLLQKIGMPTEGFLFTIFIGNYDSTPLGIHKDLPGKSVMHFHLGPGGKTMYTWDDDYPPAQGRHFQNKKPIEPHLPHATRHDFAEGDVYFMPENRFHVGTQDGLSIGIACWCNNRSNADFSKELLTFMKRNYLLDSPLMLKADQRGLDDVSGLEPTLALYQFPPEVQDLSFKDLMRNLYRDLRYALYSNAGLRNAPLPLLDPDPLAGKSTLCLEAPYSLRYYLTEATGKLMVFVRGTQIALRHIECLPRLIDRINRGEPLAIADIVQEYGQDLPPEALRYFLGQLYQHNGIALS